MYKVWKDGKLIETPYPGNYAGIKTTMKFGQLDCYSGKRANSENRIFFHFWEDAIDAGYEPCKNCNPEPNHTRKDCDHMPLGPEGGLALDVLENFKDRIVIVCALCREPLGIGKIRNNGDVDWQEGIVVPKEILLDLGMI